MPAAVIDAHVHFWDPRDVHDILVVRKEPSLARSYLPDRLLPLMSAAGISGAIAIQSAPDMGETELLVARCERVDTILGVVGWVDLSSPEVGKNLARIQSLPKVVGVRAMLNRAPRPDWLVEPEVRVGLAAVAGYGLSLDLIARPQHVPAILAVADALPSLRIVIDHGTTPPIGHSEFDDWRKATRRLAQETSVVTKFSGFAEQASVDWKIDDLMPAFGHLLECFGPSRILWASNWPVIDLRGGYARWASASREILSIAGLDAMERVAIERANTQKLYLM